MKTTVAAQPTSVPWHEDCERCKSLAAEPEPGLFTWLQFVARHFDVDHDEILVGG